MRRAAIATLVATLALADVSNADTKAPTEAPSADTAKQPAPDEIADIEAREANLESIEPRNGFSIAAALGGGIMLGGDIGVGRGPAFSLRLGHVATRRTNITFELTRSDALHKASMSGPTISDISYGLFAGAQRYISRPVWVRAAGGLSVLVNNAMTDGSGGDTPRGGVGGLVGAGIDLKRIGRYFVVGLEGIGMASLTGDGLKLQLAFALGLSYY